MVILDSNNSSVFIVNLNSVFITIIPFISISRKIDDPYLILSRQILLTKYSNYVTVNDYLVDKINMAIEQFMFNQDGDNHFFLLFKYKKVKFDFKDNF
jgi:hypothetical protein